MTNLKLRVKLSFQQTDALERGRLLVWFPMRTLEWDYERAELRMIDQRVLPARLDYVVCADVLSVAEAIRNMTVRGAPAIGAAAAFGLALAAFRSHAFDPAGVKDDVRVAAKLLADTRPTAVNLAWAIRRMLAMLDQTFFNTEKLANCLLAEAQRIADEDVETNRRMGLHGAALISDGDTVIHHCNTGALATVDWGTALGVIRMAHDQGKRVHVLVDETRPRLQGARLTAWELEQYGIPYEIIPDGAAGYFLRTGRVQKVLFGADRVAANGDVANKIGTYMLALAAKINEVPAFAVFPTSTIDLNMADGEGIPIEERGAEEVLSIEVKGQPVAPRGARALNPAFDVTPHPLIAAWVTELGVIYPPFFDNYRSLHPDS